MLYNVVSVSAVQQSESAIRIHIPAASRTSLPPLPSHPSRSSQSTELSSLCNTAGSQLAVCFTHGIVFMSNLISIFVPPSPSPPCPHVHSLHLCLYCYPTNRFIYTIFYIAHICVNIRYLFFSFWLTSLCMTDSRFIHTSTNNSISFHFMAE